MTDKGGVGRGGEWTAAQEVQKASGLTNIGVGLTLEFSLLACSQMFPFTAVFLMLDI